MEHIKDGSIEWPFKPIEGNIEVVDIIIKKDKIHNNVVVIQRHGINFIEKVDEYNMSKTCKIDE